MRRLTILLAAVGALMLVPAAQAFAEGTLTVNVEGIEGGSGEVNSIGGSPSLGGAGEGSPPIECSGPPSSGTCETELVPVFGFNIIALHANADLGSEFVAWEVSGALVPAYCTANAADPKECVAFGGGGNVEVTAYFAKAPGPTNKRALTVTKSGTGAGSVKSKPKGISCGNTCSSADASLYKNTVVTLTEKPGTGSSFTEWTGACSGSSETCTVTMSEAKEVGAVFGGTTKAIANPKTLTLAKVDGGFETGYGTVKATGLACEADCTATAALYTGGVTEPKVKPAAVVTLTATTLAGSEFNGWTGCDSETEGKCVVTMSSDKTVEAQFTALPKKTLTLVKPGGGGYGAVKSKPKGISCANTCNSVVAKLPSDTTVVLSAKAGAGSTLTSWEGCESSTNTGTEGTCTVSMSASKLVNAHFTPALKPLVNPQTLTLTKAGSGYGTVKATGLTCEAVCTTTSVNYYGGVTEPKPKAATTVTLVGTPAPGSQAVVWSGCDSETEGKCVVSMSAAKEVTATFNEFE